MAQARAAVANHTLTLQIHADDTAGPPQLHDGSPLVGCVSQNSAGRGFFAHQLDAIVFELGPRVFRDEFSGAYVDIADGIDEGQGQIHDVWTRFADDTSRQPVRPMIGLGGHVFYGS